MTIGCFINARSLASCITLDHLFGKPLANARVTLRVRPKRFHEPVASKTVIDRRKAPGPAADALSNGEPDAYAFFTACKS